jgi:hypothetical protein
MHSSTISGVEGGAVGAAVGAIAGVAGNSGSGRDFDSPSSGARFGTGIGAA